MSIYLTAFLFFLFHSLIIFFPQFWILNFIEKVRVLFSLRTLFFFFFIFVRSFVGSSSFSPCVSERARRQWTFIDSFLKVASSQINRLIIHTQKKSINVNQSVVFTVFCKAFVFAFFFASLLSRHFFSFVLFWDLENDICWFECNGWNETRFASFFLSPF